MEQSEMANIKVIGVESKAEEIQTFNYNSLELPEGYTGCWVELYSDTTYTLKW